MSYIAPNTDIRILSNIPLNNDYENTFFFDSLSDQISYFTAKTAYTLSNYTFQRDNGTLRVSLPAETVMQCNYMMYKNTSYGNKWFFAFINDVHYINNGTSEIEFELDVIQTWLFDFIEISGGYGFLENCFIERQHGLTDTIGDNIIPEEFGNNFDYIYNMSNQELDPHMTAPDSDYGNGDAGAVIKKLTQYVFLCGYANANNTDTGAYASLINFNLTGLQFVAYYNYASSLQDFIGIFTKTGNTDALKIIAAVPTTHFMQALSNWGYINSTTTQADIDTLLKTTGYKIPASEIPAVIDLATVTITLTIPSIANTAGTLDGYAPKNNKMFTYPYYVPVLTDGCGNEHEYRYEYSDDLNGRILIHWKCNLLPPVSSYLIPYNYKNMTEDTFDTFVISDYCEGSWTSDYYQAWLAQNRGTQFSILSRVFISLLSNITGNQNSILNLENAGTSGQIALQSSLSAITNFLSSKWKAEHTSDILQGSENNSGMADLGYKSVYYNIKSPKYQLAQRIDEYFTMFGYAQNSVGRPILNARSRFTYIKTKGCDINANIPNSFATLINNIFDKGIRFWKDTTNYLNYALTNSITI